MAKKSDFIRTVHRVDKLVSQCVRLSHADTNGMCRCYTCGLARHWKAIDCGHWISRGKYAVRFDERHLRPQCKMCNCWGRKGQRQRAPYHPFMGRGEPVIFEARLRKEGVDCDDLLRKSKGKRPTVDDLVILEDEMKQCLASLLEKLLDCRGVEWEKV